MDTIEKKECCICGSNGSLLQVHEKWICEKCLEMGNEERISPWKNSLEKLLKDYNEACYRCLLSEDPEDIHHARVLGRKIRSVLGFIGVPKKHPIFHTVKKVHLLLNEAREIDVLMEEMTEPEEENKVYAEMVNLLTKKQKEIQEKITESIPILINETFDSIVKKFLDEELYSYLLPLAKDRALLNCEERYQKEVEDYDQSAENKGKTSDKTIKVLHNIRKKSKTLRYIYSYLNEVLGEEYKEKEEYFKGIQNQFGAINDLEDWLILLKAYGKNLNVSKAELKAVRKMLKARLKHLIGEVQLHETMVNLAE